MGRGKLSERQVLELADYRESDAFSDLERRVIEYAERLTLTPADIPDGLYRMLLGELGHAALVEVTAEIAIENYRARFNRGFEVASQGYSEGWICAVPDRHQSSASPNPPPASKSSSSPPPSGPSSRPSPAS